MDKRSNDKIYVHKHSILYRAFCFTIKKNFLNSTDSNIFFKTFPSRLTFKKCESDMFI